MPYDPNFPPLNAELTSPAFRNQFQGLKDLIDAAPGLTAVVVDGVSTVNPGDPATVSVSFDGVLVHFSLGLPRGANGTDGAQGLPGEVTNASLAMTISGTSSNSNAVPTLDAAFVNDPPTLGDLETMRAAHNALVLALRR